MATRLDKTLKRELEVEGKLYTVTISPEGVKIVPKGARKGPEMTWQSLLSGETELRRDLNASVDAYSRPPDPLNGAGFAVLARAQEPAGFTRRA